jgi:hypothetical protein
MMGGVHTCMRICARAMLEQRTEQLGGLALRAQVCTAACIVLP